MIAKNTFFIVHQNNSLFCEMLHCRGNWLLTPPPPRFISFCLTFFVVDWNRFRPWPTNRSNCVEEGKIDIHGCTGTLSLFFFLSWVELKSCESVLDEYQNTPISVMQNCHLKNCTTRLRIVTKPCCRSCESRNGRKYARRPCRGRKGSIAALRGDRKQVPFKIFLPCHNSPHHTHTPVNSPKVSYKLKCIQGFHKRSKPTSRPGSGSKSRPGTGPSARAKPRRSRCLLEQPKRLTTATAGAKQVLIHITLRLGTWSI